MKICSNQGRLIISKTAGVSAILLGAAMLANVALGAVGFGDVYAAIKDLLRAGWRVVGSWGHARNW